MICCCSAPQCQKYGCQSWASISSPVIPAEFGRYGNVDKKPHKCPVCDGCGRVLTEAAKVAWDDVFRAGLPTSKDCHSCEGKGIIWG